MYLSNNVNLLNFVFLLDDFGLCDKEAESFRSRTLYSKLGNISLEISMGMPQFQVGKLLHLPHFDRLYASKII